MENVILSVFTLLLAIEGSMSINTIESIPLTKNGILTACAGQQISLTCSHSEIGTAATRWIASPPVNCSIDVSHIGLNPPIPPPCGPFMFQGITPQQPVPPFLNSTAVAIATTNMTDTNIECRYGNVVSSSSATSVGNISLCVVDPPFPPANLICENITTGLNVSWEAVNDTNCAVSDIEYRITVIRERDMANISLRTQGTAVEVTGTEILEPGTIYIISVRASTLMQSCFGENITVTCETSPFLPTQPPATTTESSQSSMSSSGPTTASLSPGAIVGIAIGVIVIILIFVIVIVVIIIVVVNIPQDGRDGTDQGVHAPLANTAEQQQLPLYAMVDKSQKTVAEQPTYQDPGSIQHETAPTGDVYAVTDKKLKKGPTEAELAQMYSVPDKTKGGGLNYASLSMPAGGGSEAKRPAPTEYATVIN